MNKLKTFEESKRVSTTKGFLGYKDKSLSIVEHGNGLLSVWKTKKVVGVVTIVDRKGNVLHTTRGI